MDRSSLGNRGSKLRGDEVHWGIILIREGWGALPAVLVLDSIFRANSVPAPSPLSNDWPGVCFSKAQETFPARKAIFSSSVSKNGEVYTRLIRLKLLVWRGTSLHIKNMWIKQLCNHKVRDFAMALRAQKVFKAFEKRAPEVWIPWSKPGEERFRL